MSLALSAFDLRVAWNTKGITLGFCMVCVVVNGLDCGSKSGVREKPSCMYSIPAFLALPCPPLLLKIMVILLSLSKYFFAIAALASVLPSSIRMISRFLYV